MADTVTGPTILQENDARVVIKIVNQSDGNGGTTVFGDVSALDTNAAGDSVAHLNLQRIWFSCSSGNGFDSYGRLDEEDSDTWAPISIAGGTVRLRTREVGSTTVLSTITCTRVGDGTAGQCTLIWPSGTWTAAGTFEGEIELTDSNSYVQTVNDLIKFIVRDDFD